MNWQWQTGGKQHWDPPSNSDLAQPLRRSVIADCWRSLCSWRLLGKCYNSILPIVPGRLDAVLLSGCLWCYVIEFVRARSRAPDRHRTWMWLGSCGRGADWWPAGKAGSWCRFRSIGHQSRLRPSVGLNMIQDSLSCADYYIPIAFCLSCLKADELWRAGMRSLSRKRSRCSWSQGDILFRCWSQSRNTSPAPEMAMKPCIFSCCKFFSLHGAGTVFPELEPDLEPLGHFSYSEPKPELEPSYFQELEP